MITTPPGLYYIAAGLKFLSSLACSTSFLRAINLAMGLGVFLTANCLCRELKVKHGLQRALLASILPTLYSFVFLYYTDVGAVLFSLLAYLALLKRQHLIYLLFGIAASLFRQTNIIWVGGFFLADILYRRLQLYRQDKQLNLATLEKLLGRLILHRFEVAIDLLAGCFLLAIFAAFIIFNGGSIAMGDKQSHQFSIHLAQFLYFVGSGLFFLWPILLHKRNAKFILKNWRMAILSTGLILLAIHFGTVKHPYLLADNRHWTNVLWRHVLNRSVLGIAGRYWLAPVHAVSLIALIETLQNGPLWKLGFLAATALVLIPSPLFEPRYYIIPTIMVILQAKMTLIQAKACLVWLLVVNAFVLGMFLYRPFIWPSAPDQLQRYIW